MMKNSAKLNNQGFSLVELVIVMAIIVIIGGGTVYGLTFLMSKPVEECARKIETGLQGNRNTTMGKLSSSISFYKDGNKIMALEKIDKDTKQYLVGNGVEVYYTYKGAASTEIPLGDSSNPLVIEFDRSSGSLKPIMVGTEEKYVEHIIVKRGSNKLTVTIERLTGRVTIN